MCIPSTLAAIFLLAATIFAAPNQANAWGKFGHLTVCDLAYRNFTKITRDQLNKLFEIKTGGIDVKGKGKLPDRHYTSFNLGCLEEDELPRKHPEDHFINVDRTTQAILNNECPANGECILSGVGRDFDILKDTSKSNQDRVFALMALGHWIGDIHQPLHVSFADDRGGNAIDAKVDGKCGTSKIRPDNLHAVWDNCLLEAGLFERVRQRADFKKTWGPRTITYRAVDTLQANTSLTEEKSLVGTDPWEWANESYEITLSPDVLYCIKVGNACQYSATKAAYHQGDEKRFQPISQAYLAAYEKTAQDRVKKAGFRLAHIVNLALDPSYTEPVQNSTQAP
ncbi:S1/P1 Nuclease [Mesorhizobium sp. SOD10]|nr:S1/P1 Nuclease [Mesorhizobium sp. SOD10]